MIAPGPTLRRADVVTGLLLAALGAAVVAGALRMPIGGTYAGLPNPWYASPAAFPLLAGGLLVLAGAGVAARGARLGGLRGLGGFVRRVVAAPVLRPAGRRGAAVVALLAGYLALLAAGPFGTANYTVSSSLFLAALALAFDRPGGRRPSPWRTLATVAGAVALAAAVAALFSGPLRVPLP